MAFLEALVQRGGASTRQRSKGLRVQRPRRTREIKLHGQVPGHLQKRNKDIARAIAEYDVWIVQSNCVFSYYDRPRSNVR